jgi:hypothetical protein
MWEVVGGVAAGFAIFQGIVLGVGWLRRRHTRRQLADALWRFFRLDRRLTALVAEITWKLAAGVGWWGFAIWPKALEGHLVYLENLTTELEHDIAFVRGFNADASLERLRSDVEELGECLREIYDTYRRGTIAAYQLSQGCPMPLSATGRGPVAALYGEDGNRLLELRRRIGILFRSTAYRLKKEDWERLPTGRWAITEAELPDDTEELWGSEPRPLA